MVKYPPFPSPELPEAEHARLEGLCMAAALEVMAARDAEAQFQAERTYLVSIFAVTGTVSSDNVDPAVLNDRYNHGLEQASHQHGSEAPPRVNYDDALWRTVFRTVLAGIRKPDRSALPEDFSDLLDKLLHDPKSYYHQHG
ncbi:MAG TPA: hypothetical protein VFL85_04865 [Candidatus Saccharimonadales bacterium]|nr:hypothetical protein [Candidatus Saccharimonadales bacterium]